MGLGGGLYEKENKVLPGAYYQFKTAPGNRTIISERGTVALPMALDFQSEGLIHLESESMEKNVFSWPKDCFRVFGYHENHEKMTPIREIFRNAKALYIYPLGTATKASNQFAIALKGGVRGNALSLVIDNNVDEPNKWDVFTYLENELVDKQTVSNASELQDNEFLHFTVSETLEKTASTPLTGGVNASVNGGDYIKALNALEGLAFNILACPVTDLQTKKVFVAWTQRMNEENGQYHQLVLHGEKDIDSEYVISVFNDVINTNKGALVYYTAGEQASLGVGEVSDNRVYKGEYEIKAYGSSQRDLVDSVIEGGYVYHLVDGTWRVLVDNNSFTSFTEVKDEAFCKNQTIRVLQQRAIDASRIFRDEFLGKAGTSSFDLDNYKTRLIDHAKHLESQGAIKDFDPKDITVTLGSQIDSYKVTEFLKPNYAVRKIYHDITIF